MWFLLQRAKFYIDILNKRKPDAKAAIRGSTAYSGLNGTMLFHQTKDGVLVSVEVAGLPHREGHCARGVFGFHIHEGGSCTGSAEDPFADTKGHYNPFGCAHPEHAGDLPPLFESGGHAFSVFLTDRFKVDEVIGKTVVIHSQPDDFTTQPAGNSGKKIACGVIRR